jgi:hypothetical protein
MIKIIKKLLSNVIWCKLGHRWIYYSNVTELKIVGHISRRRRRCQRCDRLESNSLIDDSWLKAVPTKEELREINLKKLGL